MNINRVIEYNASMIDICRNTAANWRIFYDTLIMLKIFMFIVLSIFQLQIIDEVLTLFKLELT